MSFTNTRYDDCAYKKELYESTSVLNHVIEKNRYINDQQCRHNVFGILQENPVGSYDLPHVDVVDVENDLYGLTRPNTRCPNVKYNPKGQCKNTNCTKSNSTCPACIKHVDTHKTCKKPIIRYKQRVGYKACDGSGSCPISSAPKNVDPITGRSNKNYHLVA